MKPIEPGKGRMIREGEELAILTIGHIGNYAIEACRQLEKEEIYPAHYDMRFVKPLDEELLHEVFGKFNKIVTVEDGCVMGGMGSAILEFMADNGYHAEVKRLGIPDRCIDHGSQSELHTECGYHPQGIVNAVKELAGRDVQFGRLAGVKKGLMVG